MKAKASEVSSRARVHLYKIGKEYYNRQEAEKLFRLDKPFMFDAANVTGQGPIK